ncbi:MAG: FliM/FliN family flagellar motor switch protein [Tatlockia sp.]|nr:FliM/FliN family flagellar motor switch protein [Tatlockia sp.]
MNSKCKPYRLLSALELDYFQQKFTEQLAAWNTLYTQIAISMETEKAGKIENDSTLYEKFILIQNENKPLLLLEKSYLELLKKSIFSENSSCFDEITSELFIVFLTNTLGAKLVKVDSKTIIPREWRYIGSPCLALTFANQLGQFKIYLHPDWVIDNLPKQKKLPQGLGNLDFALAQKELKLSVELSPIKFSLSKLAILQVGDLIKTTHKINQPLHLLYQQQKLADVEAGQFQNYKSIQLKRSS